MNTRDNRLKVGAYQWLPEVWHSLLALPLQLKQSADSIHVWKHRVQPMLSLEEPTLVSAIWIDWGVILPMAVPQYSQVAIGMILRHD